MVMAEEIFKNNNQNSDRIRSECLACDRNSTYVWVVVR